MATFVFENMTQAQADTIGATDILAFATATTNARNVGVSISTQVGTGVITLSSAGKSLNFNSATLSTISTSHNIVFNDNSSLLLGTNSAENITGYSQPNTVYLFSGDDTYTAGTAEDFVYGLINISEATSPDLVKDAIAFSEVGIGR